MRTVPLTLLLLLLHRERYYYNISRAVRNITVKEGKNEKHHRQITAFDGFNYCLAKSLILLHHK